MVDTWRETASWEYFFVENSVHCCCDTVFRWCPDGIARLAMRQSVSNTNAGKTPELRFFWVRPLA